MKTMCRTVFPVFACIVVSISPAAADDKAVIGQATNAYYNLRHEGLASFQCDVLTNWEAILAATRKSDPAAADAGLKLLRQSHMTLTVGTDIATTVTYSYPPGLNEKQVAAMEQVGGGAKQMLSGFYDTAKIFLIGPAFPAPDSAYQLQDIGSTYRLSYKEGAAAVVTTMTKDFAVSDMLVTTAEFKSAIQPRFAKSPKGLMLAGYEASYHSRSPAEETQLHVVVGYQQVSGLQIPRKLNVSGSYGGAPFAVEMTFSNCKVNARGGASPRQTSAISGAVHFSYEAGEGPFLRRATGTVEDVRGFRLALAALQPPPGAHGGYGLIGDDTLLGKEPGYGLRRLGSVARQYVQFETLHVEQPSGWEQIGVQSGTFTRVDQLNDATLGWVFFDLRPKFEADLAPRR